MAFDPSQPFEVVSQPQLVRGSTFGWQNGPGSDSQDNGQFAGGGSSLNNQEDYAALPPEAGVPFGYQFPITNPQTGQTVWVTHRDSGPAQYTGRGVDLAPSAMSKLKANTDDPLLVDTKRAVPPFDPSKPFDVVGNDQDTAKQMIEGMKQADQAMKLATLPMNMPPEPPKPEVPTIDAFGRPITVVEQPPQNPNELANVIPNEKARNFAASAADLAAGVVPRNWDQVSSMIFPPSGVTVGGGKDYSKDELINSVKEAEKTPAWSRERWDAGLNVAMQMFMAGHAMGGGAKGKGVEPKPEITEPTATPNVETPNPSPVRATENPVPTETSGTLGQVDGPIAPNAEPETGPAPGPAPVGETAPNPQVIAQQQRMKAAEAKIEADRAAANAAPPDQQITKSAQEIYDSAAKTVRTSTAGGAGPIEQRIENVVAEKRALLNRLYQMEPWRGPISDPIKLAFERAHDMATQFAEAQHGVLLPENRPNRFQGYSVEPPQPRVSEPEATPKTNPQPVRESATTATAPVDTGSPPARPEPTPEIPPVRVVPETPQAVPEPAGGIPEPVQPENPLETTTGAGAAASGEPQTTGVRNKTLEDLAAKGQTDVVPPGTGLSTAELVAKGRSAILNGVDPYEVARTAAKTNAVSPDQFGVLRAHAADLHTRSEALRTEMERNPTPENKAAFEQAYQDFSKWNKDVVQPAKTRTSDVFRAMQGEEPIDAADYTGMREAMEQRIQRGLNPMEETVLKNRAKTVEKVTQRRSQAIDALDKEIKRSSKPTVKLKSMDELRQMVAEKLKSVAPCV